ncbi:YeeE/YedE family protein [Helicobacter pametensis]|uniref:YeeE/YedE family protein n=1 Tax=Helicobacter pametensis TaxID=95149 RepID=UPI0004818AC6|nr:YeeE/YedE family protein [Helicobacter pametensis]
MSGLWIGILFGILVQRGQFCFVSGFLDVLWKRDFGFLAALLIIITIQSIGIFTLAAFGVLEIPSTPLPLFATILGGLLFGFGMGIARYCVSGGWFRSGEGVLPAVMMLLVFVITLSSAQNGLLKPLLAPLLQDPLTLSNIDLSLALSPWWLVGGLVCVSVACVSYVSKTNLSSKNLRLLKISVPLGVLGILAWFLSSQSGRDYGFGISVPSMHLFLYVLTGQQRYMNWGSLFVVGIVVGAFCSAQIWRDFRCRMMSGVDFFRSVVGGILMGVGAYLAGGCTTTNALVATAYFSYQGWLAMLMMMVGCWLISLFLRNKTCELR